MYGEQLASWGGSIPPISLRGLGMPFIPSPTQRALQKKKVWTRQDWAEYFGEPLGYQQQPGFAKDYSTLKPFRYVSCHFRTGCNAAQKMANDKYTYWSRITPTLKAEYKAASEKIAEVKKVAEEKAEAEKMHVEQVKKEKEVEVKVKEAEKTADSSIKQVMQQWEMQSQQASAPNGGKILGMEKKTAMIAGGALAAGVLAIVVLNN